MESKRCYGCMKLKTQSPLCEHCGYNEYIDNLPHQLPLGTILQGRYEIGKVLGQGGFGITYIGWDHAKQTAVAVKEFYPNGIVSRDASVTESLRVNTADSTEAFERNRKRFLQEAYVLQKLNDIPQIVHVESLFEANNTAYIVMEYIRGVDLRRYIRMVGGRLSVSKTFDILCPIMEALQKAHEAGLVHRDVSPDNIMLMPDGKAKLLDFGAAREVMVPELGHVQSTEAILKHGFAPIEQYQRNGALGPWTDVYALSATIYYCLTGLIPPDAPKRIMDGMEIPWNTIPDLSPWQSEVLKKSMEPLPRNRTRSVEEVRTALFAGPGSQEEPWVEIDAGPGPDPDPIQPEVKIPDTGKDTETVSGTGKKEKDRGTGRDLMHDTNVISGKKRPWGKIAAIAAAVVVVLGVVFALKGGKDAAKAPGNTTIQNMQKDGQDLPEPAINKNIPSQVDMAAFFTGNPDGVITYDDGSRAELYMEDGQETARALFDKDGNVLYRYLADYNESENMLYQLTFDPNNVCVRADTYTYDEKGNLITAAIILENGHIFETWTYGYNADGTRQTMVVRNHKNEITTSGVYTYKNGKIASYAVAYADGTSYESTYDSNGYLKSSASYDKDGKIDYSHEYLCDESGSILRQTTRREDGKIWSTYEYEYDADGNRIGETAYDEMNVVSSRSRSSYQYGEEVSCAYAYSGGYSYAYHYLRDIDGNIVRSYDVSDSDYGYSYYTVWGDYNGEVSYNVNTGELSSYSEYSYDEDYNFLGYNYVYYSSYDGSRTETEYDGDYKRISSKTYDSTGALKSWIEPEYDTDGNEIKSVTYNADGSIDSMDEWTYDEYGERTGGRYTYYYDDGTYSVTVVNENYDTVSRTTYDASGNVTDLETSEHEYDANGNKIKSVTYNADGSIDSMDEWTYDGNGKITGGKYTYYYDDGTYSVSVVDENYDTQSRTEYDANGKVTNVTTYAYEYDVRGNKTRQYVYDKNGKLDYWTEYFYDENGNYLDSEWHDA